MITASVVLYKTPRAQIERLLKSALPSIAEKIFVIDNSPNDFYRDLELRSKKIRYVHNENLGYGASHNLAIKGAIEMGADFHVVLNPDISFEPSVISALEEFMKSNLDVGHVMPKITNPKGEVQYLCKLVPTPFDFIFKRFFPGKIQERICQRFQLKFADYEKPMDVPYLSGCFMFFRISALEDVGFFDERFFMYPEDIDITRRIHEKYRTVYWPYVSVVHDHAQESYKSFKMLKVHIWNAILYFNKWGWFFDKKRREINRKTLIELGWKKRRATK